MRVEREESQNKLAEAILDSIPAWYDPKEEDLLKRVSKALHSFLVDLSEHNDKRIEFRVKYDLGISEMVKIHDMFKLLGETGSTGDTGKLLLDTLMENKHFK